MRYPGWSRSIESNEDRLFVQLVIIMLSLGGRLEKVLVLSDGRPGHLNQSLALAERMGCEPIVCRVGYRHRVMKLLSYLFDRLHCYSRVLFWQEPLDETDFAYVIAAGSTTFYPLKVLSRVYGLKSVAMMLPRGYRFDCDVIFAQSHDRPPRGDNIVEIPVNFSLSKPQGLYRAERSSVGIVIGGDNAVFHLDTDRLKMQLDTIFSLFPDHEFAVTTSPRTAAPVEALLERYDFDYRVIFSKEPVNPIPDFLQVCDYVFITQDSTSMISEAVSSGLAAVEVLPLVSEGENKFVRLSEMLQREGYLHIFDGSCAKADRKVDFGDVLKRAGLPGSAPNAV